MLGRKLKENCHSEGKVTSVATDVTKPEESHEIPARTTGVVRSGGVRAGFVTSFLRMT